MITIYDSKGTKILDTPINEGCKRRITLMKEDFINVRFSLDEPVSIGIGAYTEIEGVGLFVITDVQRPTLNQDTGGYDYDLQFNAHYWRWKNKIFFYTPQAASREAEWSLTATLDVHLDVFLRNLSALGYKYKGRDYVVSIDSTVEVAPKLVSYNCTSLLDALSLMAETWECEYWVTENIIHFGRCERPRQSAFTLECGVNAEGISAYGNRAEYATRLYAFGSTRNLPANYRPTEEDVVVNGIVQHRLMLPSGTPYIDSKAGLTTEEAVEKVVLFDDVYPRTKGEIAIVDTYTDTVTGDDGEEMTETFYRFTDDGFKFSKDYLLEGETLKVTFQSGKLNGMEFEVQFNPDGENEKLADGAWNPAAQVFEVVVNTNYGRKLPAAPLIPAVGDKYILHGWDSTKISELGLVAKAEQELLEKAQEKIKRLQIDPTSYTCQMMSDYVFEQGRLNDTDEFVFPFALGDAVNLKNKGYFGDEVRESRIIGIEYCLDIPYDSPILTIGESVAYSRLGALENKVNNLTYGGQTYQGTGAGGGSSVYVIGTGDTTPPSNTNVLSALRAILTFLDKTKDDRSAGQIASDIALEVGDFVSGTSGAKIWIDKLLNNQSVGELDRLIVRVKAIFRSLTIIETEALCGELMVTPGGGIKCTDVEAVTAQDGSSLYRCWFLAEQDGVKTYCKHKAGDMAKCQSFNLGEGEHENVENRYYWRKVMAVCNTGPGCRTDDKGNRYGYVDLSVTDCDSGSDIPADGDEIVQLGNDTEADRQTAIIISTVDSDSPSIKLYAGIDSYSLEGKCYMRFGYNHATGEVTVRWGKDGSDHYLEYSQGSGLKICGDISVRSTFGGKSFSDYVSGLVGEATELYRIDLSNEMAPVACDAGGHVTGTMPRCRVRVWQGSEDVTGQCAVTTSGTGVSTYRPTDAPAGQWIFGTSNMTADTATVLVTATPKEGLTLEATMSLYKVKPGPQGDSITILSKSVMYQASTNGTTPPTGTWSTAIPLVSQGEYLWCRTAINYSDGSSTTSYSVSRNGTGVTVVSAQIRYAKGNYPTQPDDSAFTLTAPGTLTKGEYLWTRTTVTYSDGASTKSYTVAYIGADGDDAVIYEIIPGADQILRDAEGNLTPATVNCSVYKVEGALRSLSNELSLRYKVLPDDTEWKSLSHSLGVSGNITVSDTAQSIVFELYSGSTVYDRETVPVLTDASGYSGGENLLKGTNQGTLNWKSTVYGSAGTGGSGAGSLTPVMTLESMEGSPRGVIAANQLSYPYGKTSQTSVPQTVSYQLEYATDSVFKLLSGNKYMVGFDITVKGAGPIHIFLEAQRNGTSSWVTLTPWLYNGTIGSGSTTGTMTQHIGARLNALTSDLTNVRCIRLSVVATQTNEYVTQSGSKAGRYHLDSVEISNLKIEQGILQTPWTPAPRDTDYLTQAFRENTDISGGVVMTSRVRVGYTNNDGDWIETGGLNGIAADYSGTVTPTAPILYCGGEMIDAAQSTSGNYATSMIRLDGTAYFANNTVRMDYNSMNIGDNIVLDEDGLHLIDTSTHTEKLLVTNKTIGTLSNIQNSVSVPVSLQSASSSMSFYRSTGTGAATTIQPLAGFYLKSMSDRTITVNNGNAIGTGGMSLNASVQMRFTLSGWQDGYLLDANISVILQVRVGSSGYTDWKTYPLTFTMSGNVAVSNTVQVTASLNQGSYYRIIVRCTKSAASGNNANVTVSHTITATGYAQSSMNKNVLGNDGLVSVWGNTVLMAKSGEVTGIVGDASLRVREWYVELKYGSTPNNGIRIQSDGIWIYVPQTGVANWKRLDIDKLWGQGLLTS